MSSRVGGTTGHTKAKGRSRLSLAPDRRRGFGLPPQKSRTNRRTSVSGRLQTISRTGNVGSMTTRKSHKENGGYRRSSLSGNVVKKDTRPIGNKKYMEECVNTLITYLSMHQYKHPVNRKQVMRPTNRDFYNIVNFLFRQFDMNYQPGSSQEMTKAVPVMFKGIGYPFSISKTALSAVGTPHTWPALLAALSWLVELLSYEDSVARADEDGEEGFDGMAGEEGGRPVDGGVDSEQKSTRMFFKYLGTAYKAFLDGDDATEEALLQALISDKEERNEQIRFELEKAQQEEQDLLAELQELEGKRSAIPGLTKVKEDLSSDLEKFRLFSEKIDNHYETVASKITKRKAEVEERLVDLSRVQDAKLQLQEEIKTQEMSAADVEQTRQDRAQLKAELERVCDTKEAMQKEVWELESALSSQMKELQETLRPYHAAARGIGLIPSTSKHANGIDYELQLRANYDGSSVLAESLLSFDVKTVLKPRLKELRSEFIANGHRFHAEYLQGKEMLDNTRETLRIEKEKVEDLNADLNKKERHLEKELARERRMLNAETKRAQEVEDELEYIKNARIGFAQDEERIVSSCTELRETLKHSRDSHARELAHIGEQVVDALAAVTDHKQAIQDALGMAQDHLEMRLSELERESGIVDGSTDDEKLTST
eukprot:g2609.t1